MVRIMSVVTLLLLTSESLRLRMNAAMPPIAWAPRLWQVRTINSVYARIIGTVIVTCERSGQRKSGSWWNFLIALNM